MLSKLEVKTLLLVERKPVIHSVAVSFIILKLDEVSSFAKQADAGTKFQSIRGKSDEASRLGISFSYDTKIDRKILSRLAAKEDLSKDVCHIERYLNLIQFIPVLLKDGLVAVSILLRLSQEFDSFNADRKARNQSKRVTNRAKINEIKQNTSDCFGLNTCDAHHMEFQPV